MVYNPSDPFFKDNFIWKDNDKAYTLLVHSLNVDDSSISAYSPKSGTFMTFPVLLSDMDSIYNKLDYLPYTSGQCIKCHKGEWN